MLGRSRTALPLPDLPGIDLTIFTNNILPYLLWPPRNVVRIAFRLSSIAALR